MQLIVLLAIMDMESKFEQHLSCNDLVWDKTVNGEVKQYD